MKYALIITFLFFISCQSANQKNEIKAIKDVLAEQAGAWNDGEVESYMAGYYRSDSLRFASGGKVSYGWETTLNRYKKGYPDKATMGKLIFSEIDIKIISDDAALVFGKWELERESDHPWGLFTLLFRKSEAGWRIVHDHTSSAKN